MISNEWNSDQNIVSYFNLYDFQNTKSDYDLPKRVDCEKDFACLLLSSGSTGHPKPIIRTHKNALNLTIQFQHKELWGLTENSVFSCQNVFAHSGGFTFLIHTIASGATAAIIPGFEGNKFINYIEKYKVLSKIYI